MADQNHKGQREKSLRRQRNEALKEVDSYINQLRGHGHARAKGNWISRSADRRQKDRRKTNVFVQHDRRTPDQNRRMKKRRVKALSEKPEVDKMLFLRSDGTQHSHILPTTASKDEDEHNKPKSLFSVFKRQKEEPNPSK